MSESNNIFISHIHEDDSQLSAMKELLRKHGYEVRDSSISSSNPNQAQSPEYIKGEILAPRIRWASTLVVLISPGMRDSEYIDWEIEYAHRQDRRIVGVWAHGGAESDLPEALEQYADAVVGWQADRIHAAITGKLNNWETSDGREREPREIARATC